MYDDVFDVRNQLSKLIEKDYTKEQLIEKLEKEIDLDRQNEKILPLSTSQYGNLI